jgi:uncharacterized protein YndB with AHSA1/START domain
MSETTKRRRITMERTFDAPIEDVWDQAIDLRPGGEMRYAMRPTAPEQIEFMQRAGMPLVTEVRATYAELAPRQRLVFVQVADFVPGVAAYDITTVVELGVSAGGVRMVVTIDAMHDERWTEMAVKGWESQLGKAARALAAARKP